MGRILIVDDCLTPERYIYLTYKGPDPWGVANKISESIRPFFHVSASGTSNWRINWDISGDPIHFYSLWWARKSPSSQSSIWIYIKVQGTKSKTKNEGSFTMQLNAEVKTEVSGWGLFLKPFWAMYSYLFYNAARRRFIDQCRNMTLNFRNEIKEHFNLEVGTVTTARGTYG